MPPIASARRPISPLRLLSAMAGVAATTYVLAEWLPVNASTAGFCYLLIVLAAATLGVFAEAALTSMVAMLCFNYYFLPPVGRFTVADPENWVALVTFLLTALVASHLSWRAQEEAAEARRRQEETEQLYALSRAILLAEPTQSIGAHGARQIAQIFGLGAVAIFDRETGVVSPGGADELPDVEEALRTASIQGAELQRGAVSIWPISLGGNPIGAIAMKAAQLSDGATQALLNLLAISMERVRAAESARRVTAARDSEEFKSTLLDAIAHEFKTPLTSIKAAATALMSPEAGSSAAQKELSSIIDEEADRLSQLVTEAVRMSRIDAGKWKLDRTGVEVDELVRSAVERFGGRGEDRIRVRALDGAAARVFVDAEIAGMALRLLLDNALKYSPPGTPVELSVEDGAKCARIVVADRGPGIADSERERVFEKFYRSEGTRQRQPGTGLGLHIAREIARAHGGTLTLAPKGDAGARFVLELPKMKEPG